VTQLGQEESLCFREIKLHPATPFRCIHPRLSPLAFNLPEQTIIRGGPSRAAQNSHRIWPASLACVAVTGEPYSWPEESGTFYPNGPPYSMVHMVYPLTGIMSYAISSLTFLLISFFLPIPIRIHTYNTTSIGLALVENAGACCPRTAPERSGRRAIPKAEIPGVDFILG
jgi:hypothetical protein